MQPLRPHGHGAPPHLHDDVADLAGGVAADPRLAVEHDAAADAGAPEDAEQRVVRRARRRARTRRRSRPGRRCRATTGAPQASSSALRRSKLPPQPGQVLGAGDGARVVVDLAGRADADAFERATSRRRPRSAASRSAAAISAATSAGRPASGSGGATGRRTSLAVVDDDRLDLGAAEIDAAAVAHDATVPPELSVYYPRVLTAGATLDPAVLGDDDPDGTPARRPVSGR